MVSQPTAKPRLPGRLGDPGMALRDDPRADPRMLAAMAPYGLANPQPPPPVDRNSSLEELRAFCSEAEVAYDAVNDAFTHGPPPGGRRLVGDAHDPWHGRQPHYPLRRASH